MLQNEYVVSGDSIACFFEQFPDRADDLLNFSIRVIRALENDEPLPTMSELADLFFESE